MRLRFRPSLKLLMAWSLAALCAFLAGSSGYIFYELNLRQHDYQILNLAGQMRVLANSFEYQAADFLSHRLLTGVAADDRDGDFLLRVQENAALYDRIIVGLQERELPADLIGRDEPLRCNWDSRSTSQLDRAVSQWRLFQADMAAARGDDPFRPRAVTVARFLAANGGALLRSTEELADAFQAMMEAKLRLIKMLVAAVLGGALVAATAILLVMRRSVLKPLDRMVAGFGQVAAGDLGFQVEPAGTVELGRLTEAFNHLSARLLSMFALMDRVGRGASVGETLDFIAAEFGRSLPLDGLALLVSTPEDGRFVAEKASGIIAGWPEMSASVLSRTMGDSEPLVLSPASCDGEVLAAFLQGCGAASALLVPLRSLRDGGALLVMVSRQTDAYPADHRRILGAIAAQVDGALARTLVMDGLVVASVQGLAKLAESRDPETGDHLVRMSLYSVYIAEELRRSPKYAAIIDRDYIRALHRFAPMHDIGKVGISDRVLLKPGRLDDEERHEMNRHPQIGAEVLQLCEQRMNELDRSVFHVGVEIAESHHEKWDGSGYPHGLSGTHIPLSARIVAVADVFDALTSKRPYKEAWSVDRAVAALRQDAGSHFDPDVVDAFLRCLPQVMPVYDRLRHV